MDDYYVESDRHNVQEEEEKELAERRMLMEEQDMDYIQSLINDTATSPEKSNNEHMTPIAPAEPVLDLNLPGAIQLLLVFPDGRLEIIVNAQTTQLKNIARWIFDKRQKHYQTFFTNFPKVEWDLEKFLCDLPIQGKKLLLLVNE
jgi:hypothetical protein